MGIFGYCIGMVSFPKQDMLEQDKISYFIAKPQHLYQVVQGDGKIYKIQARSVQSQGDFLVFYQTIEYITETGENKKEQRPMLFLNASAVSYVQTLEGVEGDWQKYIEVEQEEDKVVKPLSERHKVDIEVKIVNEANATSLPIHSNKVTNQVMPNDVLNTDVNKEEPLEELPNHDEVNDSVEEIEAISDKEVQVSEIDNGGLADLIDDEYPDLSLEGLDLDNIDDFSQSDSETIDGLDDLEDLSTLDDDAEWEQAAQSAEQQADLDIGVLDTLEELEEIGTDTDKQPSVDRKEPKSEAQELEDAGEDINSLLDSVQMELMRNINGQSVESMQEVEEERDRIREIVNRDVSNNIVSSEYLTEYDQYKTKMLIKRLNEYLSSINRVGKQRFILDAFVNYFKTAEQIDDIDHDEIASEISSLIRIGKINYKPFYDNEVQRALDSHKTEIEHLWLMDNQVVKLLNSIRYKFDRIRAKKISLIDVVIWLLANGYIKLQHQ